MASRSLLVQVVAVLSRRAPAFQPTAGEPKTFPDRLVALLRPPIPREPTTGGELVSEDGIVDAEPSSAADHSGQMDSPQRDPAQRIPDQRPQTDRDIRPEATSGGLSSGDRIEAHHGSVALAVRPTIMAVDIAGYNDPHRTTAHRLEVHEGLWTVLKTGFAEAGIPWDALFVESTGDGALILLPAAIAKADLVAQLPERMLAQLRRHNEVHAEGGQIRLRMALHTGEVTQGSHGSVSEAVSLTYRLLDAPEAKAASRAAGAGLVLMTSERFYQDVVQSDLAANPGEYRHIRVASKETGATAWLRLVGSLPMQPSSASNASEKEPASFSALVDALMDIPDVRNAESRRLLLEMMPRRELADVVPFHADDRLHVIALARTVLRFQGGLNALLDAVREVADEPASPQVERLAELVSAWLETDTLRKLDT